MTNEEAIKVLNDTKVMILKGSGTDLAKASYMAVEALKKQVVIEEILKKLEQRTMDVLKEVIEIVKNGGRDGNGNM